MSRAARTPAERRLEELAATHATRVLAYLARRTTPAEDAADVFQEVLTTAWRRIHDAPDDPDHALAWLLAIARRALANHRRANLRRQEATQRLRAELAGHRQPVHEDDAVDTVRDALARLEADDREVLALTYWDGLTSEQVSVVLGTTPGSARKRLQRARERLRRVLEAPTETCVRDGSHRGERALTRQ